MTRNSVSAALALLTAIERRLATISKAQHLLDREKQVLWTQLTPLRMGVLAPEAVLLALRLQGVTLAGLRIETRTTARRSSPRSSGSS